MRNRVILSKVIMMLIIGIALLLLTVVSNANTRNNVWNVSDTVEDEDALAIYFTSLVSPGMTVRELLDAVDFENLNELNNTMESNMGMAGSANVISEIFIYDEDERLADDDLIRTGTRVVVLNFEVELVVQGDLSGTGNIGIVDLSLMQQKIVGAISLEGASLRAADMNLTGEIGIVDLSLLKSRIVAESEDDEHVSPRFECMGWHNPEFVQRGVHYQGDGVYVIAMGEQSSAGHWIFRRGIEPLFFAGGGYGYIIHIGERHPEPDEMSAAVMTTPAIRVTFRGPLDALEVRDENGELLPMIGKDENGPETPVNYTIVDMGTLNAEFAQRGVHPEGNGSYVIAMGERSSTGYAISIREVEALFFPGGGHGYAIRIVETFPREGEATGDALTQPAVRIIFNIAPEVIRVYDENGNQLPVHEFRHM